MTHAIAAPSTAAPAEPDRLGWWATIGMVLIASMAAVFLLIAVGLPLSLLHVDFSLVSGKGWPWAPSTPWAVVAATTTVGLQALLFAVALRLAGRLIWGWHARPLALLLAAAVFAATTLVAGIAEVRDAGLLPFVVLVVLARYAVFVRELPPRLRLPRPALAAIGAAVALASVATLAYRPLHPLHVQIGSDRVGSGTHWGFGGDAERDPREIAFGYENDSFAAARVVSVEALASGAAVVVQRDDPALVSAPQDGWVPFPTGGVALRSGADQTGHVRLAPGSCSADPSTTAQLHALLFTVETLGLRRTQQIAPADPVILSCPAPRRR